MKHWPDLTAAMALRRGADHQDAGLAARIIWHDAICCLFLLSFLCTEPSCNSRNVIMTNMHQKNIHLDENTLTFHLHMRQTHLQKNTRYYVKIMVSNFFGFFGQTAFQLNSNQSAQAAAAAALRGVKKKEVGGVVGGGGYIKIVIQGTSFVRLLRALLVWKYQRFYLFILFCKRWFHLGCFFSGSSPHFDS